MNNCAPLKIIVHRLKENSRHKGCSWNHYILCLWNHLYRIKEWRGSVLKEMGLLLMNWLSLDEVIYTLTTITAGLHHVIQPVSTRYATKSVSHIPVPLWTGLVNRSTQPLQQTVLGWWFLLSAYVSAAVNVLFVSVYFTRWHWHFLTLVCYLLGYFINRNDIFGTNYNASCIQIVSVVSG